MDFLDPVKKKAHRRRLVLGYILVAIAIATTSLILLFQSYGYDLDRKTGTVIQNGLIFVSAQPQSANIYLNGQDKGQTNTRFIIPAGSYSLELKRDKYRSWKRTFSLDGGSIERLVYPLLFPEKLVTADQQLYGSAPAFYTSSPDRHWLVVQQVGYLNQFDVFDTNNPKQSASGITVPLTLFNTVTGTHSLSLVEWSTDNRHLLVRHDFASGFEFIMIDRETPNASFNINRQLNANPHSII